MRVRPLLIESTAIAGFFALGVILRMWHLDREAVEHFDEGIYASSLWYDVTFSAPYPAREFYAPPLLSTLIETASVIPGLSRVAPFLPALMCGSLTILALWWLARSWFGRSAGIFIAAVVAMSDFHVIYSRMAMTDVPCLLWIVAAVYFGTLAVQRQSFRIAILAGVTCGLAWWTKYTGWLPLAIVISGTTVWWLLVGRKSVSGMRTLLILATMAGVTVLILSPWLWQLRSVGGYSAVAANHASYLQGLSGWRRHLATQLSFQFWHDGFSGAISLGLGMIAAAVFRWTAASGSTWNSGRAADGRPDAAGRSMAGLGDTFPSPLLLIRFVAAGLALTILTLRIWTPLMLSCLALAGLSGMFLWPVLRRVWLQTGLRQTGLSGPTADTEISAWLTPDDLESAPLIDPALGFCTTLTWLAGLLLTIPLYHPYARLALPLLAAVWIAAAGGVSWWLESNLSVARRLAITGEAPPRKTWAHRLVSSMLSAAVVLAFLKYDENNGLGPVTQSDLVQSSLFSDRTSIVRAAEKAADLCVMSARGELPSMHSRVSTDGAAIHPEDVLNEAAPQTVAVSMSPDTRRQERLVVYAFGEPALLMHLNNAGIAATPVSHLNLGSPEGSLLPVPTFVIIGPNAKRTPGFWEQWMERIRHFEHVGDVHYAPSDVTLLDLFSPKWLSQHPEARDQIFEVHRVR